MTFDLRTIALAAILVAMAVFAYRLLFPPQAVVESPARPAQAAEPSPLGAKP